MAEAHRLAPTKSCGGSPMPYQLCNPLTAACCAHEQAHLFQPGLSMQQFMWQPDLAGVAKFVADGLDILRLD